MKMTTALAKEILNRLARLGFSAVVAVALVVVTPRATYARPSSDGNSAVVYVLAKAGVDTDGDGLSDTIEIQLGTNPANADSDSDGMADGWEVTNGLNPLDPTDADDDPDGDGLANGGEFLAGSLPFNEDTDGDQYWDALEVARGTDPASYDSKPVSAVPGDVNCDGRVNAVDVQMVISGAMGIPQPAPVNVNHAGGVNATDVQLVINAALNL